ncbi:MAG: heme ABC exporter ATP-binding protein CcmA [Chloroherpetonaceae bacterium]|nr:heme ABC exporter ATP-binding protein CcmA [Chthonomonadaceae bacterium]MDW8208393.1 heme ABC exporter ATP-binding protein CcmA [Chloroherpetonaceae bacterium]
MDYTTEEVCITLQDVAHRFGHRPVFAPVCTQVQSGQVLAITGPNGSGKSTLLRIIAGLLPATRGTVTITVGGRVQDAFQRRRFIGYVAPDLTLYRELTGAENLLFFARLQGVALSREALAALLATVGLRGRGRDPVRTYSSGMRQRLKYAFALLHRPPVLLLDEPTANLDRDGRAMVEDLIARQRARPDGVVVLATNEPEEVAWGDIVVHLEGAR